MTKIAQILVLNQLGENQACEQHVVKKPLSLPEMKSSLKSLECQELGPRSPPKNKPTDKVLATVSLSVITNKSHDSLSCFSRRSPLRPASK